jgi:citrate lyase gamma subunit
MLGSGPGSPAEQTVRVYGYMRFSYAGRSDARASRNKETFEEVAAELYEPRRMERRFFLFENLCLPSLQSQTNQDFRLLILASDVMPEIYKKRLAEITADVPQIEILYSSAEHVTNAFNPHIEKLLEGVDVPTAHFRLDDDDAMSCNMVARIEASLAMSGMVRVVSYPNGLYLTHQEGNSYLLREHFPFVAIGFALLNPPGLIQNPYQCGHTIVQRNYTTFSDPTPASFIHSAHDSSDTRGAQARKFAKMLSGQPGHNTLRYRKSVAASLKAEFPGCTIESLKDLIKQASEI